MTPVRYTKSQFGLTASRAQSRRPDFQLDAVYPVCWPTYRVRLTASVMKKTSLSTVAHHVLRLVDNGVRELGELVRLLCLPENYIAGAAVELLRAQLIEQGTDLRLDLTEKGNDAIKDKGMVKLLQTVPMAVPFDPLTRTVPDIGVDALIKQDAVRDEQLFVVQYAGAKPGPRDLRLEDVRRYQDGDAPDRRMGGSIIDISGMVERNIRLQYRKDIVVAKMSPPGAGDPVFLAYSGHQYLEEETERLQQLAERGVDLVPGEFEGGSPPWESVTTLSSEEEAVLKEIDELGRTVDKTRLDDARDGRDGRAADRPKRDARAAAGSGKASPAEERLAAKESKLSRITDSAVRLIKTEDHHGLLLDAINQAGKDLTLVSAWIDPFAFDGEVRTSIAASIKRGVTVRIAWGLGVNGKYTEAYRNKNKGKKAINELKKLLGKDVGRLIVKTVDTHEKFIICDNKFCAWGSFNWLSYRGNKDRGYRRETSMYSTRKDDIRLWKENASALFQTTS